MSPSILSETPDYLVLMKPAGLVVHSDGRTREISLSDWLMEHYPQIKEVGEPWTNPQGETIWRPGIVHRLDRDTSGVMVVAKSQEMYEHLKSQFQDRETEKVYHALVYGVIKEAKGKVDRPIGKSRSDFRLWSAQRGAKGEMRDALTEYRVLERNKEATLVEIRPKTGRTHQIRVHMKAIHHPVLCDPLYAPNHPCLYGLSRTALHAQTLSFTDLSGKPLTFTAPYPEDFAQAITAFRAVAEETALC